MVTTLDESNKKWLIVEAVYYVTTKDFTAGLWLQFT